MVMFKTSVVKQAIKKIEAITNEEDLVKVAEKLEQQKNKLKSSQEKKCDLETSNV